jgi:hypothetical protein
MSGRHRKKYIYEGNYVAEIEIEVIEANEGWSPYISLEDAFKLDDIRSALRKGNVKAASKHAKIYTLTPVS